MVSRTVDIKLASLELTQLSPFPPACTSMNVDVNQ